MRPHFSCSYYAPAGVFFSPGYDGPQIEKVQRRLSLHPLAVKHGNVMSPARALLQLKKGRIFCYLTLSKISRREDHGWTVVCIWFHDFTIYDVLISKKLKPGTEKHHAKKKKKNAMDEKFAYCKYWDKKAYENYEFYFLHLNPSLRNAVPSKREKEWKKTRILILVCCTIFLCRRWREKPQCQANWSIRKEPGGERCIMTNTHALIPLFIGISN